ncbi:hypothetical protein [Serratia symbiotica]|nr:hypothetical protein [Serratia symbiotica]
MTSATAAALRIIVVAARLAAIFSGRSSSGLCTRYQLGQRCALA